MSRTGKPMETKQISACRAGERGGGKGNGGDCLMGTGYSGMMKKSETTEGMGALTATELYTSAKVNCMFCGFYLHF